MNEQIIRRKLTKEEEYAIIDDLSLAVMQAQGAVLMKHNLEAGESVLLLKSLSVSQVINYSVVGGVTKAQLLEEISACFDAVEAHLAQVAASDLRSKLEL